MKPGKSIQIASDLLLLRANSFDILGGHVQELVDKWEVAQRYSKYSTGIRALTQAPPWQAFGKPIDRKSLNPNKKSLVGGDKKDGEEDKEDVAFDNQRKEAIAEAQKLEPKMKVFADGAKKIVHHNVQKIVDKGYSEEVAKEALKYTRNDLGKALANLKKGSAGDDESGDGRFRNYSGRGGRGGRGGGRGGRGGGRSGGRYGRDDDDDGEEFARPSEKISLFDFIGDKLPPEVKNAVPTKPVAPVPPLTASSGGYGGRSQGYGDNPRSTRFNSNSNESHHNNRPERDNNFRGNPRHGQGNTRPPHQATGYNNNPRGPPSHNNSNNSRPPTNPRFDRNNPQPTSTVNIHPRQNQTQQSSFHQRNNNNKDNNANTLAMDMNRMSLSSNNPRQQSHHQRPPHQQQQQPDRSNVNAFPSLDTKRTPGFQNKDTNEAAKKFLQQDNNKTTQQPTLSQGGPQFQQNHRPQKANHNQSNFQQGMGGSAQQFDDSKSTWNWKIGDRCLAKYWEDGKYYNAEITGIAGRTCVVSFMEYGNYEEVLKDDCLPITG